MKRAKVLLELSRDCEMVAKSRIWVHELNASPIGGREQQYPRPLEAPKAHSMTHPEPSPFLRHDWTTDEIVAIHDLPLLDLIADANRVHRQFHDVGDVQKASLLSIKTGGSPEDCPYSPQSAHYREVHLDKIDMMKTGDVLAAAAR